MRSDGIAYVGALVAALTTLGLQAAADASPAGVPPDSVRRALVAEPRSPAQLIPVPSVGPVELELAGAAQLQAGTRVTTVAPPAPRSRDIRRRRRSRFTGPVPTPAEWTPPEGPVRIGLQAGHWRADEAPRELSGLRGNGTSWRGTAEWEVNLAIARRAGAMLEELGYEVDILPAVVPPGYRAHLFISIHADGSSDPNASGYRVASPRRDATGRASQAAARLEQSYGEATGLKLIPTATRRMRNYYAFNSRRYEHALHPMTVGVIIETGFLTSWSDRQIIVNDPERAARGIVAAILAFPDTPPPGADGGR